MAELAAALALLLAAVLMWGWLQWWRPLRRLLARAQRLAEGDLAALEQPVGGSPSVERLRQAMASMASHVRRAQEQEREQRSALAQSQETERARVAHELHDDTVQAFIAIAQRLEMAEAALPDAPQQAAAALHSARQQALESVASLRRLIADLLPPALAELGVEAALRMFIRPWPIVSLRTEGPPRRLDEGLELTLFRTGQEAVRNALRHAAASRILVTLRYTPEAVQLEVEDDGRGFVPQPAEALARTGHYGLLAMQARARQHNGSLHIASAPGSTRLALRLPITPPATPAGTVTDPVCGAVLLPEQVFGTVDHEGTRYYFCCPVCRGAFIRNPALALKP
jgi:signal transduction histidine kinase/YHS domain-containing protein